MWITTFSVKSTWIPFQPGVFWQPCWSLSTCSQISTGSREYLPSLPLFFLPSFRLYAILLCLKISKQGLDPAMTFRYHSQALWISFTLSLLKHIQNTLQGGKTILIQDVLNSFATIFPDRQNQIKDECVECVEFGTLETAKNVRELGLAEVEVKQEICKKKPSGARRC